MRRCLLRSGCAVLVLMCVGGCATTMPGAGFARPESHALAAVPGESPSAAFAAPESHGGRSAFRMLSAGIDGLLARVELIDAARHTLDLQYYIFRGDESGQLVESALLRAAQRGVRIRLLVDDGDTVAGDEKVLALAAQPGVEVRVFNPLRYRGHVQALRGVDLLLEKGRVDYRMHNKLLVADNALALIGGRNIGDQYFQIDPNSQFGDDDVLTAGPIVPRLSAVFDEFWNSRQSVPAQAFDRAHTSPRALAAVRATLADLEGRTAGLPADFRTKLATGDPLKSLTSDTRQVEWATVQLAYDSPDKNDVVHGWAPGNLIYDAFSARAMKVDSELVMITPYLVPTGRELTLVEELRARRVRVRMLTNSLIAAPSLAAQAGYMHYRPQLLGTGVELHEVRSLLGNTRGSGQGRAISKRGTYGLHGKLYVFDRRALMVGSMNFDRRSRRLNTEIGVIIDSPELARLTANRFEELTRPENSYQVTLKTPPDATHPLEWRTRESGIDQTYTVEPARSAWQRFKVKVLTLLVPDKEL